MIHENEQKQPLSTSDGSVPEMGGQKPPSATDGQAELSHSSVGGSLEGSQLPSSGGSTPVEPPPEGPGGIPPEQGWGEWFAANNPLYLLSVLFMFGGLFLASKASQEGASLGSVIFFFGIQNVYELVMIAMGLYLLKTEIQPRHGMILLAFILLFLGDITFYQFRISAMCSTQNLVWVSTLVSTLYLGLAALKMAAIIKVLEISCRWEQLAFPIGAFGLIYLAPQYFLTTVYNLGDVSILQNEQYPQSILFQIWLLAAAMQIPVIVGSWTKTSFDAPVPNRFLGDENRFYGALMLVPFFVLPVQIGCNIMTDERLKFVPLAANFVPYLLCGIFFLQTHFRKTIATYLDINLYDFLLTTGVFLFALATSEGHGSKFTDYSPAIYSFNLALIIIASLATTLTRKNIYSAAFLGTMGAWYSVREVGIQAQNGYAYLKTVATTTWAGILMVFSFVFLGLGFIFSLTTRRKVS